jgi:hypothetical protein
MATVYCDNCGTSLLEETAKFCRACGKPTPLSEAATRRFDEQPVFEKPTSPVGSFTTPAYMAPFEIPPVEQTNDLRQKRQKRNLIILVSMLAVMIFALAGLLAFLNFGVDTSQGTPSTPPVASAPPVPPVPPMPPPLPGMNGPSAIESSLIYPGSRQTMSINREGGKSVVQLVTDDPATTVAAWYEAKLKAAKKVTVVGQTILKAGDTAVMIMGSDEGAQILITKGDEE